MSSRKKSNAVLKDQEDFTTEILSDELQETLKEVDEASANEFLQSLQDELLSDEPDSDVTKIIENHSDKEVLSSSPDRVFDDKTAVIDEPENQANSSGSRDGLKNVTSLDAARAESLHLNMKRNPSIDLKNADYIKFAQTKIKALEKEVGSLRAEAQELALAGSHFKTLAEEREFLLKSLEAKVGELQGTSFEEKNILNEALKAKDQKISVLQSQVESLEAELESKYNRLRVRERELESRLEILKREQEAVFSSKDEMILHVKKQNNALNADLDKLRSQNERTAAQLQERDEALRRTVKALKLSLTMLESQKQE